ncbi:hypothetical protein M5K25_012815 [Dendrobium thyrsiflorum]|uniref:glycerophosphodiester phosphodiesterase n=1 Tax=Dendrobium thyrsiflorum TaxID=117978 RepID=A0ABD0UYG0_DENTH
MRAALGSRQWRRLPQSPPLPLTSSLKKKLRLPRIPSKRLLLRLVVVIVLIAFVPPVFFHFRLRRFHQMRMRKCHWLESPPLVCAHGGDSSRAAPNTMDAYRIAIQSHVDCIEIDVSRSLDGTLFALHDRCLSKCDSEVEFEETWSEMINQGDLQCHDSESTNNVCHGISKATSSITDCFLGLKKLMISWRRNEQDEDFRCSQSDVVPVIRSSPILKQAARFYSRKLYSFFEEEFLQGVGGMSIVHASADSSTFFVKNADRCDQPQQWTVHFDAAESLVHCTYGKFSMMGILCSHLMRVFRQMDISKIPSQYLLLRWSARGRKDFYAGPTVNGMGNKPSQSNERGSGMIFRNHLSRFAYQISTRAQGNEDAEQYMLDAMVEMADNVDFILAGKANKQPDKQAQAVVYITK